MSEYKVGDLVCWRTAREWVGEIISIKNGDQGIAIQLKSVIENLGRAVGDIITYSEYDMHYWEKLPSLAETNIIVEQARKDLSSWRSSS